MDDAIRMEDNVPAFNEEKLRWITQVKNRYDGGEIDLEEARGLLRQKVHSIAPYEVALAEQCFKDFEEGQCRKEDIQGMLDLFEGLIDRRRPVLSATHPIARYYAEIDKLERICAAIDDLAQYPVIKNQWYELFDRLKEYKRHLSRKQNQLYSVLERKGFDRPTTTMWTLDDFVWEEIGQAREALEGDEDAFLALMPTLTADLRDLSTKEETVFYPTSLAIISPAEFQDMISGDREIGFAWVGDGSAEQAETGTDAATTTVAASGAEADELLHELTALLGKHGATAGADAELHVAEGSLTLDQINLIYRHLPVDLSYVDENEIVRFYSDTAHRVFPRSKNVIGRNVMNCHPRKSAHIVREIIDRFRAGEQDKAEFWINKPDLFIYIIYQAVRDEQGTFRGILEMMQDCTHIRALEGSRTLLTWDNEQHGAEDAAVESEDAPAQSSAVPAGGGDTPVQRSAAPNQDNSAEAETASTVPDAAPHTSDVLPAIGAGTQLKDLLDAYPWLRKELVQLNGKFAMLQTPLARVMISKATIASMADRSSMEVSALIDGIRKLIASHH